LTDIIVYNPRIEKSETLGTLKVPFCLVEDLDPILPEYIDIS